MAPDWVGTPGGQQANDGWDYMRSLIDTEFPDVAYIVDEVAASTIDSPPLISLAEVGAGVVTDVAGLPEMALAGALLMAVNAFGWLERWVASWFPDPSIFGWHPLGFIQQGLSQGGQALQDESMGIAHRLANFFVTPIRGIFGLFQRLTNAVSSAHTKIAHVVNHSIPDAIAQLTHQSTGSVTQSGNDVANAVAAAFNNAQQIGTPSDAAHLVDIGNQRGGLTNDLTGLAATVLYASDQYAQSLHQQSLSAISAAQAQAQAQAQAAALAEQQTLLTRLAADESSIAALHQDVAVKIPAEVQQITTTEIQRVTDQTNQQLSVLSSRLDTMGAQVGAITTQVASDEALIANAQSQIDYQRSQQVIDQQAITQQQSVITAAQLRIDANVTAISTLHSQILATGSQVNKIQSAQQLNSAQLAPFESVGAVALPALLASMAGNINNLKTKVDQCMVENCDPQSPNNIVRVLKSLWELLSTAGEIGFVAEAVKNPLGTANALSPFLQGFDETAITVIDGLLSL